MNRPSHTPESNARDAIASIPNQTPIPWMVALAVSWGSLRRRFFRSLVTMIGVVLAIAFLCYMLLTDAVTRALIAANHAQLNELLQKNGVDIFNVGGPDQMMFLLLGLSLLTCMVGIVNSMLMSVTERIKEIGTLKCLGALDSFIVKTYFIESSLQGIIGTLLGILIGIAVALAVAIRSYGGFVMPNLPLGPSAVTILISFVIGALISIFASIAPAYWAARKEPVEAMRVEE